VILVENLAKQYGRVPALRGISFHARRGEIVGFLGPNGAGKTTTMRILTGYMPPSGGSARVAGFDVLAESLEVRRRIGYLPETVPLYPEMTVREYLDFMGDLRSIPHREARVQEVLGEVDLVDRAEGLIGNLSKGLRQRVGLAQALLHKPDVLILDEPTIGLDPGQIIEVRRLIREVGKERTVLLSTHILSEVQQVCQRVLILHRGSIVAEDTPENLQAQLAGAERLLIRAGVEGRTLAAALEGLSGVKQVRQGEREGEVEVASSPGRDIRAAVARRVVESGWDLLELRPAGVSLEDVFLQLTRDESDIPEAADDA
jgi:ABC-2 type transport system ATP-binding protein